MTFDYIMGFMEDELKKAVDSHGGIKEITKFYLSRYYYTYDIILMDNKHIRVEPDGTWRYTYD